MKKKFIRILAIDDDIPVKRMYSFSECQIIPAFIMPNGTIKAIILEKVKP